MLLTEDTSSAWNIDEQVVHKGTRKACNPREIMGFAGGSEKMKNSPCLVEQSACAQGSHFKLQQTVLSPVSGVRMKKGAMAVSLRSVFIRGFYHHLRPGNAHRMLSASHDRAGLYSSNAKEICHCMVIEECQWEIGNCTDNLWMSQWLPWVSPIQKKSHHPGMPEDARKY